MEHGETGEMWGMYMRAIDEGRADVDMWHVGNMNGAGG